MGPGGPDWLAEFDPDDRAEALSEIRNAVVLTMISEDPDPLRNVLHAWATTAAVMRDPLRRDVHTGPGDESDYIEATRRSLAMTSGHVRRSGRIGHS
ncbi:hypothetical protein ACIBEK_33710 [Nocardia fusca]|uniref:hypothetical protein n=1 Tax=Nocardia fusca TaxID=941183 RepID=UPI003787ED96